MAHEKTFILVPYWAVESLRRHQMELNELLNLERIAPIFSNHDLAEMVLVQSTFKRVVGEFQAINSLCEDARWTLLREWEKSVVSAELRNRLEHSIIPLAWGDGKDHEDRLYDPSTKRARDEQPFITYDISATVGAIVVYPGWFTDSVSNELQVRALESVLKTLYVYNPYHEVSRTPWFRQYLTGLADTQARA